MQRRQCWLRLCVIFQKERVPQLTANLSRKSHVALPEQDNQLKHQNYIEDMSVLPKFH